MSLFRQWIDFHLLGRHRLEKIPSLPLGCRLADAVARYGQPVESSPAEESPQVTQHSFAVGAYHQVVALEWQETLQSITYWSVKSDPARDLAWVLKQYQGESQWHVMQEGYWYQRDDNLVRLWCSAAPAIGMAYVEFLRTRARLKTEWHVAQVASLPDPTWAANDAVFELQRQFVEGNITDLNALCERSDKIVVSPDGRAVLILRDHHGYDVGEGFRELNSPPQLEKGYATPVLNFFTTSPNGSSWGKVVLPRDAVVTHLGFTGDRCELELRQPTTDRVLRFRAPPEAMRRLCGINFTAGNAPHRDAELWEKLQVKAKELSVAE